MMIIDHKGVRVLNRLVLVRMHMRLRAFATVVLMLMMRIVCMRVQMRNRCMHMLQSLAIGAWAIRPKPTA